MSSSKATPEPSEVTLHLAYAEASVLIIESLARMLIERNVLSVEDVIDTFETAIETKHTLAAEGVHPEISSLAAGILSTIANSLAASRPGRR
jgi:hypothetical protein